MTSFLDSDLYKIAAPVAGYIGGVVSAILQKRLISRKEAIDYNQKIYENSNQLMKDHDDKAQAFTTALLKYSSKTTDADIEDFVSIASSGDKFFNHQNACASAILGGMVSENARNDFFINKFKESRDRLLPLYYKTLQTIAAKKGFKYEGSLKRENYEAIYSVLEKFGAENNTRSEYIFGPSSDAKNLSTLPQISTSSTATVAAPVAAEPPLQGRA